jgi:hypothetical protein
MIALKFYKSGFQKVFLVFSCMFLIFDLNAQNTSDTSGEKRLYRPPVTEHKDTIYISDSLYLRQQYMMDSIDARHKFIQDSIIAREIFVRDSIIKRQRILDSLNFLKSELPRLIDAALKTLKEDIIINNSKIDIIGDSTLCDYSYRFLPFDLTRPFVPWKVTINLSDNPIEINIDKGSGKIISIRSPSVACSFNYGNNNSILKINEPGVVLNRQTGRLYKAPFDSVFFNRQGRIIKIKRYIHFYQVVNGYQRGAPLFVHLSQVKQFEYNASNQLTKYQLVNFCDRWSGPDDNKVCYIITYSLNIQAKTYILTRQNDPSNDFSDGTFTFEFDTHDNLKSLAFKNTGNSENWKTFVELNEDGNVSRYLYQVKGVVHQSLDIIYNLDDPYAKYKVELITCTFEDDGVSYYQKNNTTGKSRFRDKMTGEWSPWK